MKECEFKVFKKLINVFFPYKNQSLPSFTKFNDLQTIFLGLWDWGQGP